MRTRKSYTKQEHDIVVDMWLRKAGRVREIAEAMGMPATTVYGILDRAGVWPGTDNPDLAKKPSSELELLLNDWPMAKLQADLNKSNVGKPNRHKVSIELAKFMATAVRAGFNFKEISAVTHVDAKTVAKYAREFAQVAPRRSPPVAQAQNMSLPIQFAEPEPGLLRRIWNWMFR
jgi:hypothetical protein